ncbi:MAG: RNA polymerase sigma-70 factor (family 1) [Salibacteraceae bacterium]
MTNKTTHIFSTEKAFEVFFKESYAMFCLFANGFTNDPDDAEEIVQNTFVKFWESRKTLVIGDNPKAYLFTMIRNACLNQKKHISIREEYKVHNERELTDSQFNAEDDTLLLQDKIQIAIQKMPSQRKKIFEMSKFEGLKYREIAENLNISIKTVENHMGSAMKDMRMEFKDFLHIAFVHYLLEGLGENVNSIVLLVA